MFFMIIFPSKSSRLVFFRDIFSPLHTNREGIFRGFTDSPNEESKGRRLERGLERRGGSHAGCHGSTKLLCTLKNYQERGRSGLTTLSLRVHSIVGDLRGRQSANKLSVFFCCNSLMRAR